MPRSGRMITGQDGKFVVRGRTDNKMGPLGKKAVAARNAKANRILTNPKAYSNTMVVWAKRVLGRTRVSPKKRRAPKNAGKRKISMARRRSAQANRARISARRLLNIRRRRKRRK